MSVSVCAFWQEVPFFERMPTVQAEVAVKCLHVVNIGLHNVEFVLIFVLRGCGMSTPLLMSPW